MFLTIKTSIASLILSNLLFCYWCEKVTDLNSHDYFTSLEELKLILRTEKELPNLLNLYFHTLHNNNITNRTAEKLVDKFMVSKFSQETNEEAFLGNPVNVYLLIKRLTVEFKPFTYDMIEETFNEIIKGYFDDGKDLRFPTENDLKGVAMAFSRLQRMYHLDIAQTAAGKIFPGINSTMELTAEDCHEIARQMNLQNEFLDAIVWLETAILREKEENPKSIRKVDLLSRLSYCCYQVGHYSRAYRIIEEVLRLDPKNEKANQNFPKYKRAMLRKEDNIMAYNHVPEDGFITYKKLCNNENLQDLKQKAKLKCYYLNKSPFLRIQPIKVEDIHLEPWVATFYEVVSNNDIELIKNLSIPRLDRAVVADSEGNMEQADYRIGKSAWIEDYVHPTIKKISRNLYEITGLEIYKAAEPLQVVNYGIGGQYDPHHDFEIDYNPASFGSHIGNRIATVLLYLSDVEIGGATVFPRLNITVHPKKGAGAFWYNMLKTGVVDMMTEHGACPVLIGNKWVANKWIHEHHQEFKRPCSLSEWDYY